MLKKSIRDGITAPDNNFYEVAAFDTLFAMGLIELVVPVDIFLTLSIAIIITSL